MSIRASVELVTMELKRVAQLYVEQGFENHIYQASEFVAIAEQ